MRAVTKAIILFYMLLAPFVPMESAFGNLSFSTYLGGSSADDASCVAIDSDRNTYIFGNTISFDFPTLNPYQGTYGIFSDLFMTKLSSSGSSILYSTFLGGNLWDYSYDLAIDSAQNAYLTGQTYSIDFPTLNPYQGTRRGVMDAFVTKLSSAGSNIIYSTYLGGSSNDYPYGIALNSSGSAYVAGGTASSDFPTLSPYQGTQNGINLDAFVTKLSSAGNALSFSTYFGGNSSDAANAISLGISGSIYIAGQTYSSNFPTINPYQGTKGGGIQDAFMSKLSGSGSTLFYSTYLGGTGDDFAFGIAVDFSNNAYIAGSTTSTDFPTSNPYAGTSGGGVDAFITKFSGSAPVLTYSTYMGGSGEDSAIAISLDLLSSAYVTGRTYSTDFPTRVPYQGTNASGGSNDDAFVTVLSPPGSALFFSTYLGGSDSDYSKDIAVDLNEDAYISGSTSSTNFPTKNPYQGSPPNASNAFVTKIGIKLPSQSTPGVFRPSTSRFLLRNTNSGGAAEILFNYGLSTDTPVIGDWDDSGTETAGLYRPSNKTFYLRNTNSGGAADIVFLFGGSGDLPVMGDWDGDGLTTAGAYRPSTKTFYLRNTNSSGPAELSFIYGGSGDTPLTGDWDGDGMTTVGAFRPSTRTFYLRNSNSGGASDIAFVYGGIGDMPLAGDWDGDGITTVGAFRPTTKTFYLRNTNTAGSADLSFVYGGTVDIPITGNWDGI